MVRKHIIFYGRVQGVGFRYYSVYKARALGLTGWVRNLYDGTVEMEVQGKRERDRPVNNFFAKSAIYSHRGYESEKIACS